MVQVLGTSEPNPAVNRHTETFAGGRPRFAGAVSGDPLTEYQALQGRIGGYDCGDVRGFRDEALLVTFCSLAYCICLFLVDRLCKLPS